MKLAYLASKVTLPGSPTRRPDAFEHDRMMEALTAPLEKQGISIEAVDWASDRDWAEFDAALIGTAWDYWDHQDAFLARLSEIETKIPLFNSSETVRWNSDKTYLRDLESCGAILIPTLWLDTVTEENASAAFDHFRTDDLVFKRQVGAGAAGQHRLNRVDPIPEMPHAMMVQPFLPMIQTEGELSFIFIDGQFCHALIKRAKPGDYRIQSSYGGFEEAIEPGEQDLATAYAMMDALEDTPLYARVDMLRSEAGDLLLMELELIEPYLYPLEGPELGQRIAEALIQRLG